MLGELKHKTGCVCVRGMQQALPLAWANRAHVGDAAQVAPTLEAFPLRTGHFPAAVLAGGSASAVLLSEHGNTLEKLQFPVRALRRGTCVSVSAQVVLGLMPDVRRLREVYTSSIPAPILGPSS